MALQHGEFFLEYQPLGMLTTPRGSPLAFLGPLLRCGVIRRLQAWYCSFLTALDPDGEADGLDERDRPGGCLRKPVEAALDWPAHSTVAVNLSPAEFLTAGFTDRVSQRRLRSAFPPSAWRPEITETVLLERTINNLDTLNTLGVLGIQISLDDFGTDYSSLSYLKNFPSDNIKIDKYFIDDLLDDEKSRTIVRSVIALSHGLGMRVTAEGVETTEQSPRGWRLRDAIDCKCALPEPAHAC